MSAACKAGCMGWVVVRQDVHGSRFEVASFATSSEAEELLERFEAGYPHRQMYFVEESQKRGTGG